jgi:cell division septal protein FtsQ
VADVVAERLLPGTVVIHVRERVPIARLDRARQLVVDAEGLIFEAGERSVKPVLYGWKGRARAGARVDAASRTVLEFFPRFPARLREWTRRIVVTDTLTLTLLGGTEIRFGLAQDLEPKARVAEAILRTERGKRLAYIDVRSPSVPVSRPRDEPTPGPSPVTPSPQTTPATAGSPPPG